jgi:hypothetical protein
MASSSLRLQRRHSRLTFIHLADLSCKVSHTELGRSPALKLGVCHTILGKMLGMRGPERTLRPSIMQSREADGSTSPPRQRRCCNHREDKRPARPAPFALRCRKRRNALDLGRVPRTKKKNLAGRYVLETGRLAVGDDPATLWGPRMHPRCFISAADSTAPEQDRCPKPIRLPADKPYNYACRLLIKRPASVDWFVRE